MDPGTRWDFCDCSDTDLTKYKHEKLGYTFVEKAWGNLFYKTYGETTMNYLDAKAKCESERVTRKNVKQIFLDSRTGAKMSENFWEGEEQNVRNDLAQVKKRQKYFWNSND